MKLLIPPPVVAVAIAALMWLTDHRLGSFRVEQPLRAPFALLLAGAGLLLMVLAVAQFLRARTTVNPMRPERSSQLVTTGMYAVSRNPIYLGDLLVLAGFSVWLGNWVSGLWLAVFVVWITRFQILPEEDALRARFGAGFVAYCARVRRWL